MPDRSIKDREKVLCLHSEDVSTLIGGMPKSWMPLRDNNAISIVLATGTTAFLPRWIADYDPTWRHFCTYTTLRDRKRVFVYRRGSSGGEERLHGKLSLGVGGHVGLEDFRRDLGMTAKMVEAAALREVDEELLTGPKWDFSLTGLIADDSSPVNRVHLGVTYTLHVDSAHVKPRESCLADPTWMTLAQLQDRREEFESWSQFVIDRLSGDPSCT